MQTQISNLPTALAGLVPVAGAAPQVSQVSTAAIIAAAPDSDLAQAVAEEKALAAKRAPRTSDAAITKGVATIAQAVEIGMRGEANIYEALAKFGEAAKLAGADRKVIAAVLKRISDKPDTYLPADCPVDVRAAVLRRCDQAKDAAEFSRTTGAICAGSVLVWGLAQVREWSRTRVGGMSGFTRVAKALLSDAAKIRADLDGPVPADWNGGGLNVITACEKGASQEASAQAGTNAKRAQAQAGIPVGAPGGPVPTPSQAQASTSPVPPVAPVPTSTTPAPVPTSTTPAPAAPVPTSTTPAPAAPVEPAWSKRTKAMRAQIEGFLADTPDSVRETVKGDLGVLNTIITRIETACAKADRAKAEAANPAGKLVKKS